MKLRRSVPNEPPPVATPAQPATAPPTVGKPTGLLISVFLFITLTVGIVLLNEPTDAVPLPTHTLQANRMDTERHIVWVRLDSLRTRLDALTGDNGLSVRVEPTRLYLRADSRKQLERYLLNGMALNRFIQASNSPVRPESAGNGFSLPVQQKNGIAYVQAPTDLLSSLLRSTESVAE